VNKMAAKILIVDDDQDLCDELSEVLSDNGYLVETASNGMDGQACIKKNRYHVILLDYRMPGLSGVDVLKFIKKQQD